MGELASALDGLAAEDLFDMAAGGLLDRTAELVRARNRIDVELARTVRRAELTQAPEHDGLKTMASWPRGHARLSPTASAQLVRNGRALENLPAVAAGCSEGAITAEQVTVIAPVTEPENVTAAADQGVDVGEVDVVLAETAATRQHVQLGRVVHHYLARLDPDGDTRTRAQQLGDAMVQLADNVLASGTLPTLRTVKPQLLVTIGIEDLLDPSSGAAAAEAGFGAILSAARARWAACDGTLTRMVLDPDGVPLDHGRTKRLVSPQLRRAVELRDGHCVFAGCAAPTHWCDVHHVREWLADHGETSLENSALLCERHHTKVHHGFRIERMPDGRWRTYRPEGTEILIHPPLRI